MQKYLLIILSMAVVVAGCRQNRYKSRLQHIGTKDLKLAPESYSEDPGLPSPALYDEARELILLKLDNGHYTWFDATVENGEPFDYKRNLYGKGNQLTPDKEDFPSLAGKGVHSDEDLRNTKTITGRSVPQITIDGRPWGSSGVGFLADDETIMSVIYSDNQTVKKMGLTHPDIARPLFHVWNLIHDFDKFNIDTVTGERLEVSNLVYNSHLVMFKIEGSRGWQESIFNDEILGSGHFEMWREMNEGESEFLNKNYSHLSKDQLEELKQDLSYIHTGEMVFFYINRYGFYEGHTEYRADPVAVAFIFGLKSIEELHLVCESDIYKYFTSDFTVNHE